MNSLQSAIRIPQSPHRLCSVTLGHDFRILTGKRSSCWQSNGIVQRRNSLELFNGLIEFAKVHERYTEGSVSLDDENRVLKLLRQVHQKSGDLMCRFHLGPEMVIQPEQPTHSECFRRGDLLRTQLKRPVAHLLHFRGSKALRGHERNAEDHAQVELLLHALGRFWQGIEGLQPATSKRCRFVLSRTMRRVLCRL